MSSQVTMPPKRPALVSASTSSPHSSLHSPLFPPRPRLHIDDTTGGPTTKNVSFRRSSLDPPMEQIINETSPLMRPRSSGDFDELNKVISPLDDDDDDWQGNQSDETKSSFFLFLLTLGGLGLQIGWSVETSNGSVSQQSTLPAAVSR